MKKLVLLVATGSLAVGCAVAQTDDTTEQAEQAVTYNCSTDSAKLPTKAALAAAMASELGRWDIYKDLYVDSNGRVALVVPTDGSANGVNRCPNKVCARTDAILGLQVPNSVIPTSVFDATAFKEDLKASFDRQKTAIQDALNQENCPVLSSGGCGFVAGFPTPFSSGLKAEVNGLKNASCMKTPEDHKMVFKSSSTVGPCGAKYNMYTYTVQKPGGGNLCNVNNLQLALSFFGWTANTYNPNGYIAFSAVDNTVTIDPTDTDIATPPPPVTSVKYDYDRVSDPTKTLLGTSCTTQAGLSGSLADIGRGMLGCKAGGTTTVTEPCTPTATATVAGSYSFNTTAAYCLKVTAPIAGWGVSNFTARTLKVNGTDVTTMGAMPLPVQSNGAWYFWSSTGTGALSYAAIYFW